MFRALIFLRFFYWIHSFLMLCGNRCEQMCRRLFPLCPYTLFDLFSCRTTHYFGQMQTYWKCHLRTNANVNTDLMWIRNQPNVNLMQLSKARNWVDHSNGHIILNYNIWIHRSFHILCTSLIFNSLANSQC